MKESRGYPVNKDEHGRWHPHLKILFLLIIPLCTGKEWVGIKYTREIKNYNVFLFSKRFLKFAMVFITKKKIGKKNGVAETFCCVLCSV